MDNLRNLLDEATRLKHQIKIISDIRSGKEAAVYRVLLDDELVAMKLYKNPEERTFKNTGAYLTGKHYKTASHQKAILKNNKFAKKLKQNN